MIYMLDTDICSYIIRKLPRALLTTVQEKSAAGHSIYISVITYQELRLGAARSKAAKRYHGLITMLCERLDHIAAWTVKEADAFAQLQADLFARGGPIGHNDTMIAAHALCLKATLVSNNRRRFARVPGLELENWLES